MLPFLRFAGPAELRPRVGVARGGEVAPRAADTLGESSARPSFRRDAGRSEAEEDRERGWGRKRDRLGGEVAYGVAGRGEAGEAGSEQGGLVFRERARVASLMAAAAGAQPVAGFAGSGHWTRPRAREAGACQRAGGAGGAGRWRGRATGVIRAPAWGRARRPRSTGLDQRRQNQGCGQEREAAHTEDPASRSWPLSRYLGALSERPDFRAGRPDTAAGRRRGPRMAKVLLRDAGSAESLSFGSQLATRLAALLMTAVMALA